MDRPKTFDELVTWACWTVMEGFVKGESLRTLMWNVLDVARRWKPADK